MQIFSIILQKTIFKKLIEQERYKKIFIIEGKELTGERVEIPKYLGAFGYDVLPLRKPMEKRQEFILIFSELLNLTRPAIPIFAYA